MWTGNDIILTNLNAQQTQLLILFLLWEMVLKGIALYKAARNKQVYWFIAILILNTIGILPIIYIRYFQKDKNKVLHEKKD